MSDLVTYELDDGVAVVSMDDGKANALSRRMFAELDAAFDRSHADGAAVVLTGRPGVFSGGFDLKTLRGGDAAEATGMLRDGFALAERVLAHPRPVVTASSGHAIAMGLFLLMCGDARLGARGDDHRYIANEVMIGLTMPRSALAILRHRLTPAELDRAAITSALYSPEQARTAGVLTDVVEPSDVQNDAVAVARAMATGLNADAFAATKLRSRAVVLAEVHDGLGEFGA